MKSVKNLEICRIPFAKSVRYRRKICCTSGWGVHCVHPGGPGHPQRSAKCVAIRCEKVPWWASKLWKSLGSMDGHPSNWLSWVLTHNPMAMMCDWWKPIAGTLKMCLFSHCDAFTMKQCRMQNCFLPKWSATGAANCAMRMYQPHEGRHERCVQCQRRP